MPGHALGNTKYVKKMIDYNNRIAYNLEFKNGDDSIPYFNGCFQDKVNYAKRGFNDPTQTTAERFSQLITNSLGGRTTFGDINSIVKLSLLGGTEGQPGGLPRPLRNKF